MSVNCDKKAEHLEEVHWENPGCSLKSKPAGSASASLTSPALLPLRNTPAKLTDTHTSVHLLIPSVGACRKMISILGHHRNTHGNHSRIAAHTPLLIWCDQSYSCVLVETHFFPLMQMIGRAQKAKIKNLLDFTAKI